MSRLPSKPSDTSEWLAALSAPNPHDVPGPDWKTIHELSHLLGLKRAATQARINEGIKAGRVEKKMFRVPRSDGAVHSLPHYRIIPQ